MHTHWLCISLACGDAQTDAQTHARAETHAPLPSALISAHLPAEWAKKWAPFEAQLKGPIGGRCKRGGGCGQSESWRVRAAAAGPNWAARSTGHARRIQTLRVFARKLRVATRTTDCGKCCPFFRSLSAVQCVHCSQSAVHNLQCTLGACKLNANSGRQEGTKRPKKEHKSGPNSGHNLPEANLPCSGTSPVHLSRRRDFRRKLWPLEGPRNWAQSCKRS